MGVEYVSRREFARRVGVNHSYINRLVKQAKIPVTSAGIPWEEGKASYDASSVVGSDGNAEWNAAQKAQKTNKPVMGLPTVSVTRAPAPPAPKPVTSSAAAPTVDPDVSLPYDATPIEAAHFFNIAKANEKMHAANIKGLEFRARKEELIEKEDVVADAVDTVAEVRSLLLSIPSSIAPQCEGKSAREIEGLIEGEIMKVMIAFKNSVYARGES